MRFTVTDDDTGTTTVEHEVRVEQYVLTEDPFGPGNVLLVGGTDLRDVIHLSPLREPGSVELMIDTTGNVPRIREDFEELWGHVPSDFSSLRVLFEARWDAKPEGAGVRAEVWYDDLALHGP